MATKTGRITAVRIAPQIAQNSQLGKFAPAILITGSHPASADAAASSGANLTLAVEEDRMRERLYAPDGEKERSAIQFYEDPEPQTAYIKKDFAMRINF